MHLQVGRHAAQHLIPYGVQDIQGPPRGVQVPLRNYELGNCFTCTGWGPCVTLLLVPAPL
jgi:hypothetical protein